MIRYNKTDWIWASIVFLLVLIIAASNLTVGIPEWGDDFAAYISEGLAIAENHFQEQIQKNFVMHPSSLPEEASEDVVVYAWGYPLLLSAVYKIVGFDRSNYNTVIWYKLPSLIGLALFGGILVLFYRRRFSLTASVLLSLLLCMNSSFFLILNILYSDLTFVFFSMLSLFLAEIFIDLHSEKSTIIIGVLYGAVLWLTHEIRLNGITVCLAAVTGHLIHLLKNRKEIKLKSLWLQGLPYIVLITLTIVTECFWLAPATKNMSDVGNTTAARLESNTSYYWGMILEFFESLTGAKLYGICFILILAAIIGVVDKGITDNLHLTVLIIGTFIVLILLPYRQGVRYIFNILPLILMFVGYGFQWVLKKVKSTNIIPGDLLEKYGRVAGIVVAVYILTIPVFNQTRAGIGNINHFGNVDETDVYSPDAIDMYNFIQENVPEENNIAFGKPRALYLNTERLAFRPGYNGHKIADADYYLEYQIRDMQFLREKTEADETPMDLVYENESFKLYSVRGR